MRWKRKSWVSLSADEIFINAVLNSKRKKESTDMASLSRKI
ncbi:Uncharacterized protein APZ42_031997 [Daphnia magna]|uniref:Uncharacterized protein n=1 Tax=Daphnia magna TaxID=35525 RepID=A0A164MGC4_9CRUS|nr:Uncharacterized protein APZ42_031997 [Daphnia magna]